MKTQNGDYYREKQRRKGRLVKVVEVTPATQSAVIVAVCGRNGEEVKDHRERVVRTEDLERRYDKVEEGEWCCCVMDGISTFARMNGALSGDCYDNHKVFVCGGCGRVTPWCRGGDREDNMDPDGDFCDDCAVAYSERKGHN